jgi:hypothetical protein
VRNLLLFVIAVLPAAGQSGTSSLVLSVRPQCGIISSTYSQAPGSSTGVLRFAYVARTGVEGGKLLINMPLASGEVHYQTNLGGPAVARPASVIVGTTTVVVADIPPNGRTVRSGSEGEMQFVWSDSGPTSAKPILSITCQ